MRKTIGKKFLSLGLSAALVGSMLATSAFAADGDETIDTSWFDQSASSYTLMDEADLLGFAQLVNGGETFAGKTVILGDDVDLSGSAVWQGARGQVTQLDVDTNSPAVTKASTGFAGTFDGNKKTLTVDINSDQSYLGGLIGYLEPSGVVKDLTVDGTVASTGGTDGNAVGGVVGYNCGTIDHVTSSVVVSASDVYNVGGIAGFNDNYYKAGALGIISNCIVTEDASVTGREKVGGIVGENAGVVASCSNAGKVTGTSDRKSGVGGIVGRNGNNDTAVETGVISTCLNTGAVSAGNGSWAGGIAGFQNSDSTCSYSWSEVMPTGYVDEDSEVTVNLIVGSNDNDDGIVGCTEAELDGASGMYGTWKSTTPPTLSYNATNITVTPAKGWQEETTTIYVDDFNGTGTTTDAEGNTVYHNLADAVDAANGGEVYITKTIVIDEKVSLYDSVTFKQGYTIDNTNEKIYADPLFEVNVPNEVDEETGESEVTYVTMTSATVDAGSATAFSVVQGRLRLRGNINVSGDVAVAVSGSGQVEVNYAQIKGTTHSFEIAGADNTFILNDFGTDSPDVKIDGNVYLGSGAKITLQTSLADWTSNLIVESADKGTGIVIATCPSNAIAIASAPKITVNGSAASVSRGSVDIMI